MAPLPGLIAAAPRLIAALRPQTNSCAATNSCSPQTNSCSPQTNAWLRCAPRLIAAASGSSSDVATRYIPLAVPSPQHCQNYTPLAVPNNTHREPCSQIQNLHTVLDEQFVLLRAPEGFQHFAEFLRRRSRQLAGHIDCELKDTTNRDVVL